MNDAPESLAEKLRMILRVTGCGSQKELYAKLKNINPRTGYDPERAYKWFQGRATPRNHSVYDDLARLLGLNVGGDVLRTCSYKVFHDLLAERYGAELPYFVNVGQTEPKSLESNARAVEPSVPDYLVGRYLSMSRAWSPHRPGCLIWGITNLLRLSGSGLGIEYVECLPRGDLTVAGPMRRVGRNLITTLVGLQEEVVIQLSYAMPPPPGIVLVGTMSGSALHDAEMRLIACRVLSLRLPGDADVIASGPDCYLDMSAEDVARQLVFSGFTATEASDLAPDILDFVLADGGNGLIDVPISVTNTIAGKILGGSPFVAG